MAEFASKGVGTAALTTGIIGSVGALAGGMLNAGNLFGGCNNGWNGWNRNCNPGCGGTVSALEAALAQERAERFTEQQTAQSQREMYTLFREEDDRIKQVVKDTTGALIETGNALAKLNEQVECIKKEMEMQQIINEKDLHCVKKELEGAIALEAERRTAGDQNLYCYVNATFVPGKLVMPTENICPEVMPRYNSWTAPTTPTESTKTQTA